MYEDFFNLCERPFSEAGESCAVYSSSSHQEGLSYIRYGLAAGAGFIIVTGEAGSGKTTLLQSALGGLDSRVRVVHLVNSPQSPEELIEALTHKLGLRAAPGSKPHLLHELSVFLTRRSTEHPLVLAIDKAEELNETTLEEIRMLSNLETEKSKLIQVLLVGGPGLREVLAKPALRQLQQRVSVGYHLRPLDAAETAAYVNHQLRRASRGALFQFPPAVSSIIHQHSDGLPRRINSLADGILLCAYRRGRHSVSAELARAVAEAPDLWLSTGVDVAVEPAFSRTSAPSPLMTRDDAHDLMTGDGAPDLMTGDGGQDPGQLSSLQTDSDEAFPLLEFQQSALASAEWDPGPLMSPLPPVTKERSAPRFPWSWRYLAYGSLAACLMVMLGQGIAMYPQLTRNLRFFRTADALPSAPRPLANSGDNGRIEVEPSLGSIGSGNVSPDGWDRPPDEQIVGSTSETSNRLTQKPRSAVSSVKRSEEETPRASTAQVARTERTAEPAVQRPSPVMSMPRPANEIAPPRVMPLAALPVETAIPSTESTLSTAATTEAAESQLLEERSVRAVLDGYRRAYNRLDVAATRTVWPSVDSKALVRAFDSLESQALDFFNCRITASDREAVALCAGSARYVPKVGNKYERNETRLWNFDLKKSQGGWTIENVETR
jgi:type II secretory pathway predicted ATPase ExeA